MEKSNTANFFTNLVKVIVFLGVVLFVISKAPNYIKEDKPEGVNLIINNNNVTKSLKNDIQIDGNGVVYLSMDDIQNFFDEYICYDKQYNQILTGSQKKLAAIGIDNDYMMVNSSKVELYSSIIKMNDKYYLPFSELQEVYNVELKYIEETNIITIDSLNREAKRANTSSKVKIKYLPTMFSKNLEKLNQGEDILIIEDKEENDGWYKVRTQKGNIGYIRKVSNEYIAREAMEKEKTIKGKVSLAWDYFSEYSSAPNRTGTTIPGINVVSPHFIVLERLGKGNIDVNIGEEGTNYIKWAHDNGYKVWPMVSNNSYQETSSEILNDYKLREKLINKLIDVAITNKFDGLNIDFEYLKYEDKDVYSRFLIELAARMNEYGLTLSTDVTAPDGSEDWSLCFDRKVIADVSDYIMFMAYDQHGVASKSAGTVAGCDWVEENIEKFIGREEVAKEKLVLALPFYTRVWKGNDGNVKNVSIYMKDIKDVVPADATITWDDKAKQNYAEYSKNGERCRMWIEDAKSIEAKFELMNKYDLAGAAYWTLGGETKDIWNVVQKYIK